MIDVREFRVGNWIVDRELEPEGSIYWQVEQVNKYGVSYKNGSCWTINPEPIQLTEEILLKCGFVKEFEGGYCDKNRFVIFKNIHNNVFGLVDSGFYYSKVNGVLHLKNLHQLQNLYLVLTGQELEFKP